MPISLEPLVEIQRDLTPPGGRDYWTAPQESGKAPIFSTQDVARIFFARTKIWFNVLLVDGKHVLDGEVIDIPRTEAGYRQFQLYHVELIAHAFLSQGIIDLRTFRNVIRILRGIADNYRLI